MLLCAQEEVNTSRYEAASSYEVTGGSGSKSRENSWEDPWCIAALLCND